MNEQQFDIHARKQLVPVANEVPEWISKKMDDTLSELKRKRKQGLRRKIVYGAAASCIVFGGIGGAALVNPPFAEALRNIPLVDSILKLAGDSGIRQGDELGLATQVNISAEDQGVRITVKEMLYDGVRLTLGYRIEGDSAYVPTTPQWYIDGIQVNGGTSQRIGKTEDGAQIGVISFTPSKALPARALLELRFGSVLDRNKHAEGKLVTLPGHWSLQLPRIQSNVKTWTKKIAGAASEWNGRKITVSKVVSTPAVTRIEFETIGPNEPLVDVAHPNTSKGYQVLDDSGMYLEVFGVGGSSGPHKAGDQTVAVKRYIEMAPLQRIPDHLILRPYTRTFDYANARTTTELWNPEGPPITLSQGAVGDVTIIKIEFTAEKTLLHFRVHGNDPYQQAEGLWLENASGQKWTGDVVFSDAESMLFIKELPAIDSSQDVRVAAVEVPNPEITRELEVMIPLK
jgi:hypothetical protein